MRTLRIRSCKESVLQVDRSFFWKQRLVYILVANKPLKYPRKIASKIIYIGTTGRGSHRPATSAVAKAMEVFGEIRGVNQIDVHLLTCAPRRNVQTWKALEAALLTVFEDMYWSLPLLNKKHGEFAHPDDLKYFRADRLKRLIRAFEEN